MRNRKLALSTIESILVVLATKGLTLTLEVEDADKCAFIIFAIVDGLSANIKHFDRERTLTETIFHQMIRYFFCFSSAKQIRVLYKVYCDFVKLWFYRFYPQHCSGLRVFVNLQH